MTQESKYTVNSNELKENRKMPLTMTVGEHDQEYHLQALVEVGIQDITTKKVHTYPILVDISFKATLNEFIEYRKSMYN